MSNSSWLDGLHHDGSEVYISNPNPQANETVMVHLRVPVEAPVQRAYLRALLDGEQSIAEMHITQRTPVYNLWSAPLKAQQPRIDYRFKLMTDEGAWFYNAIGCSRADSPDYYDFSLLAEYAPPLWVREQVFYQIFPDRFADGDPASNVQDGDWIREGVPAKARTWGEPPLPWKQSRSQDYYGGDLQGIAQHLDHLQRLGVTALYLTPIFTAGSNHRYDIIRFDQVDPHVGGDEGLAQLRAALDEYGMKLMLDITPNHIGVDSLWFKAAHDREAPEASFFFYDEAKQAYETWLGVPSLLKLNYTSQELRERFYRRPNSALRRWLKPPYRIDGWRLDVANMTGNLQMSQLDHEVWKEIRPILKADDPNLYLLGEYFMDGTAHTQGDELDAAMNYAGFNVPMRRWLGGDDVGAQDAQPYADTSLLPTEALALQMRRFLAAVPYTIALQQFNQLESHDTIRLLTVCQGDVALAQLGVVLLMGFVGVPCLYYGTEVGLDGGKDPDNRRCMVWDEATWNADLLAFHQRAIALRHELHPLKHGSFQMLLAAGDHIAYLRASSQGAVIVGGNRGATSDLSIPARMGGIADGTRWQDRLSGAEYRVQNGILHLENMTHGQAFVLVQMPEVG